MDKYFLNRIGSAITDLEIRTVDEDHQVFDDECRALLFDILKGYKANNIAVKRVKPTIEHWNLAFSLGCASLDDKANTEVFFGKKGVIVSDLKKLVKSIVINDDTSYSSIQDDIINIIKSQMSLSMMVETPSIIVDIAEYVLGAITFNTLPFYKVPNGIRDKVAHLTMNSESSMISKVFKSYTDNISKYDDLLDFISSDKAANSFDDPMRLLAIINFDPETDCITSTVKLYANDDI